MAERLVPLQEFCCFLGFFDHGTVYSAPGLMAADGAHLGQSGKKILAQELFGLIDTDLN